MDRKQYLCTKCGGPRSRRSASLCIACYTLKPIADIGACAHHWVYAAPGGPISTGVCKLCGDRSYAANSIQAEFAPVLNVRKESERKEIVAGRSRYVADANPKQRLAR